MHGVGCATHGLRKVGRDAVGEDLLVVFLQDSSERQLRAAQTAGHQPLNAPRSGAAVAHASLRRDN